MTKRYSTLRDIGGDLAAIARNTVSDVVGEAHWTHIVDNLLYLLLAAAIMGPLNASLVDAGAISERSSDTLVTVSGLIGVFHILAGLTTTVALAVRRRRAV